MTLNPPCKGCEDRHPACHGRCDRYTAWAEEHTRLVKANRNPLAEYYIDKDNRYHHKHQWDKRKKHSGY